MAHALIRRYSADPADIERRCGLPSSNVRPRSLTQALNDRLKVDTIGQLVAWTQRVQVGVGAAGRLTELKERWLPEALEKWLS